MIFLFFFPALSLSVLTNKKFKSSQSQTISVDEVSHLVIKKIYYCLDGT